MKAILMSIKPKYCELIASGKKTVEVRKTKPNLKTPFKVYIYATTGTYRDVYKSIPKEPLFLIHRDNEPVTIAQSIAHEKIKTSKWHLCNGKVIGEFVCDSFDEFDISGQGVGIKRFRSLYETCLTVAEMRTYGQGRNMLYGWHISDLKIYDKPKELGALKKSCDKFLDCIACKRKRRDEIGSCNASLIHPPQSWCYCEKLEEV